MNKIDWKKELGIDANKPETIATEPEHTAVLVTKSISKAQATNKCEEIYRPDREAIALLQKQIDRQTQLIAEDRAKFEQLASIEAINEKLEAYENLTICANCGVAWDISKNFKKDNDKLLVGGFTFNNEDVKEPYYWECPVCKKKYIQISLAQSGGWITAKNYAKQLAEYQAEEINNKTEIE